MKTPGFLMSNLFYLRTLVVLLALSIGLQISKTEENTLVENTSTSLESLEVRTEKFVVKVTGKDTMGAVMNLIKRELNLGTHLLNVKS